METTTPNNMQLVVELPIDWNTANAPAVFANQMVVQADEHECHLSFFEIQPPLIYGSEEEKKEQLAKLTSIPARCVVRVIITKDRLKKFAEALVSTLAKIESDLPDSANTSNDSRQEK